MPLFEPIPHVIRGQPLSLSLLSWMLFNDRANLSIGTLEHTAAGAHNAWEVPLGVYLISQSAGTYSVASGSSGGISSVVKAGTGQVIVNLDPTKFVGTGVACAVLAAERPSGANKPVVPSICGPNTTSTQVEVELFQLSSALGLSGNDFAYADCSFYLILYSVPPGDGSTPSQGVTFGQGGAGLLYGDGSNANGLNAFIAQQGRGYASLIAGHQPNNGAHNALEPARDVAIVQVTGTTPALTAKTNNVSSVSRIAAGQYRLTFASGILPTAGTAAVVVAGQVSPSSGNNPCVMVVPYSAITGTTIDVFLYAKDTGWHVYDGSFAVEVHCPANTVASSSYLKVSQRVQDSIWGVTAMNQAIDNQNTLATAWAAEHSTTIAQRGNVYGVHNTIKVPRAVGAQNVSFGLSILSDAGFGAGAGNSRILSVGRSGVGQYSFSLQASGASFLQTYGYNPVGQPGIMIPTTTPGVYQNVQLSALTSGNWLPADPSTFCFQLFAQG